jgi:ribosome-associated heat shock protein Hsp15
MAGEEEVTSGTSAQRLDKWLWFARILKSRTLAATVVTEGKVRVNGARATKASHTVRAGDVLTIGLRGRVHILRVLAPGVRRGPPAEARQLYEPVMPARGTEANDPVQGQRERGAARPTKRDRRQIDRLTDWD